MIQKKLPNIDIESAAKAWERHTDGSFNAQDFSCYFPSHDTGIENLTEADMFEFHSDFSRIREEYDGKNMKNYGGYVDSEIVEVIHSTFKPQASTYDLSQAGFWMWLSNIAMDGFLWDFIAWRFGANAAKVNWGITNSSNFMIEGYLSRAWLRGHKMFDPSLPEPYEYAKKGLSDLWRSHILRTEFGKDREFVKAFLDVIDENSISSKQTRISLIPAIRAYTSNAAFSHLNYEDCKKILIKFIEKSES